MSATATKSRRTPLFPSYNRDLAKITEVPLDKRRELAIGRNGAKVTPRKFHLSADELAALRETAKTEKRIPNPHNFGNYFAIFEALILLGHDTIVPLSRVVQKVKSILSDDDTKDEDGKTAWERFENKKPRNKETGRDVDGRFLQNVFVLQRLTGFTPYGLKILQTCQKVMGYSGGVIDVLQNEHGTVSLRLNTKSTSPINQMKTRGMGSTAAVAAEKAARKTAKTSGKRKATSKSRNGKAKTAKPTPAPTPVAASSEPTAPSSDDSASKAE